MKYEGPSSNTKVENPSNELEQGLTPEQKKQKQAELINEMVGYLPQCLEENLNPADYKKVLDDMYSCLDTDIVDGHWSDVDKQIDDYRAKAQDDDEFKDLIKGVSTKDARNYAILHDLLDRTKQVMTNFAKPGEQKFTLEEILQSQCNDCIFGSGVNGEIKPIDWVCRGADEFIRDLEDINSVNQVEDDKDEESEKEAERNKLADELKGNLLDYIRDDAKPKERAESIDDMLDCLNADVVDECWSDVDKLIDRYRARAQDGDKFKDSIENVPTKYVRNYAIVGALLRKADLAKKNFAPGVKRGITVEDFLTFHSKDTVFDLSMFRGAEDKIKVLEELYREEVASFSDLEKAGPKDNEDNEDNQSDKEDKTEPKEDVDNEDYEDNQDNQEDNIEPKDNEDNEDNQDEKKGKTNDEYEKTSTDFEEKIPDSLEVERRFNAEGVTIAVGDMLAEMRAHKDPADVLAAYEMVEDFVGMNYSDEGVIPDFVREKFGDDVPGARRSMRKAMCGVLALNTGEQADGKHFSDTDDFKRFVERFANGELSQEEFSNGEEFWDKILPKEDEIVAKLFEDEGTSSLKKLGIATAEDALDTMKDPEVKDPNSPKLAAYRISKRAFAYDKKEDFGGLDEERQALARGLIEDSIEDQAAWLLGIAPMLREQAPDMPSDEYGRKVKELSRAAVGILMDHTENADASLDNLKVDDDAAKFVELCQKGGLNYNDIIQMGEGTKWVEARKKSSKVMHRYGESSNAAAEIMFNVKEDRVAERTKAYERMKARRTVEGAGLALSDVLDFGRDSEPVKFAAGVLATYDFVENSLRDHKIPKGILEKIPQGLNPKEAEEWARDQFNRAVMGNIVDAVQGYKDAAKNGSATTLRGEWNKNSGDLNAALDPISRDLSEGRFSEEQIAAGIKVCEEKLHLSDIQAQEKYAAENTRKAREAGLLTLEDAVVALGDENIKDPNDPRVADFAIRKRLYLLKNDSEEMGDSGVADLDRSLAIGRIYSNIDNMTAKFLGLDEGRIKLPDGDKALHSRKLAAACTAYIDRMGHIGNNGEFDKAANDRVVDFIQKVRNGELSYDQIVGGDVEDSIWSENTDIKDFKDSDWGAAELAIAPSGEGARFKRAADIPRTYESVYAEEQKKIADHANVPEDDFRASYPKLTGKARPSIDAPEYHTDFPEENQTTDPPEQDQDIDQSKQQKGELIFTRGDVTESVERNIQDEAAALVNRYLNGEKVSLKTGELKSARHASKLKTALRRMFFGTVLRGSVEAYAMTNISNEVLADGTKTERAKRLLADGSGTARMIMYAHGIDEAIRTNAGERANLYFYEADANGQPKLKLKRRNATNNEFEIVDADISQGEGKFVDESHKLLMGVFDPNNSQYYNKYDVFEADLRALAQKEGEGGRVYTDNIESMLKYAKETLELKHHAEGLKNVELGFKVVTGDLARDARGEHANNRTERLIQKLRAKARTARAFQGAITRSLPFIAGASAVSAMYGKNMVKNGALIAVAAAGLTVSPVLAIGVGLASSGVSAYLHAHHLTKRDIASMQRRVANGENIDNSDRRSVQMLESLPSIVSSESLISNANTALDKYSKAKTQAERDAALKDLEAAYIESKSRMDASDIYRADLISYSGGTEKMEQGRADIIASMHKMREAIVAGKGGDRAAVLQQLESTCRGAVDGLYSDPTEGINAKRTAAKKLARKRAFKGAATSVSMGALMSFVGPEVINIIGDSAASAMRNLGVDTNSSFYKIFENKVQGVFEKFDPSEHEKQTLFASWKDGVQSLQDLEVPVKNENGEELKLTKEEAQQYLDDPDKYSVGTEETVRSIKVSPAELKDYLQNECKDSLTNHKHVIHLNNGTLESDYAELSFHKDPDNPDMYHFTGPNENSFISKIGDRIINHKQDLEDAVMILQYKDPSSGDVVTGFVEGDGFGNFDASSSEMYRALEASGVPYVIGTGKLDGDTLSIINADRVPGLAEPRPFTIDVVDHFYTVKEKVKGDLVDVFSVFLPKLYKHKSPKYKTGEQEASRNNQDEELTNNSGENQHDDPTGNADNDQHEGSTSNTSEQNNGSRTQIENERTQEQKRQITNKAFDVLQGVDTELGASYLEGAKPISKDSADYVIDFPIGKNGRSRFKLDRTMDNREKYARQQDIEKHIKEIARKKGDPELESATENREVMRFSACYISSAIVAWNAVCDRAKDSVGDYLNGRIGMKELCEIAKKQNVNLDERCILLLTGCGFIKAENQSA